MIWGDITHEEIKNSACYFLYALLPLTDRKRRKRGEEQFLKECAADIVQAPLVLENARKSPAPGGDPSTLESRRSSTGGQIKFNRTGYFGEEEVQRDRNSAEKINCLLVEGITSKGAGVPKRA